LHPRATAHYGPGDSRRFTEDDGNVVTRLLCICIALASCAAARAQPIPGPQDQPPNDRFDPGELRSTLVVPETRVERFRHPVIDTHSHAYAETPAAIAAWVGLMDRVGIKTSFILSGATGSALRDLSAKYAAAHPGRFVMFAGFDKEGVDASDYGERLRRRLRADVAAGAAGLGELTDKGLGLVRAGDRPYYIDDLRFDPLWDEAGVLGVPVFVHIAEPAAFYEPADARNDLRRSGNWSLHGKGTPGYAEMIAKFERVLARHPRTRFVSVHAFNLANDLGALGRLLDRHPNVEIDFAARMWELARQPFSARRFFSKYADRILLGTDNEPNAPMYLAHVRQLETQDEWFWPADAEWWRGYGMGLPDGVLKKVYAVNAGRLLRHGLDK
jgi:predicted TIM-barrel fold metal-dependent hydrolase